MARTLQVRNKILSTWEEENNSIPLPETIYKTMITVSNKPRENKDPH